LAQQTGLEAMSQIDEALGGVISTTTLASQSTPTFLKAISQRAEHLMH
jgi:hypothetical protein